MIDTLIVDGYRSFSRFEMGGLGNVNLLVGENNSGKTSLLEAIQIVASNTDPQVLWSIAARRGEFFVDESEPGYRQRSEIDISHWFHGFDLDLESTMLLSTLDADNQSSCRFSIFEAPVESQHRLFPARTQTTTTATPTDWPEEGNSGPDELISTPTLALSIVSSRESTSGGANEGRPFLLTSRGGLTVNAVRSRNRDSDANAGAVVFVPTAGLSTASLVAMVDDLTLTDEEGFALQAMQTLDSRIERFAPNLDFCHWLRRRQPIFTEHRKLTQ